MSTVVDLLTKELGDNHVIMKNNHVTVCRCGADCTLEIWRMDELFGQKNYSGDDECYELSDDITTKIEQRLTSTTASMNEARVEIKKVFDSLQNNDILGKITSRKISFSTVNKRVEYLQKRIQCKDIHREIFNKKPYFDWVLCDFMLSAYVTCHKDTSDEDNEKLYLMAEQNFHTLLTTVIPKGHWMTTIAKLGDHCSLKALFLVLVKYGIRMAADEFPALIDIFLRSHGHVGMAVLLTVCMNPPKIPYILSVTRYDIVHAIMEALKPPEEDFKDSDSADGTDSD